MAELIKKIKTKLSGINKKEYFFIAAFSIVCIFNSFVFNQFDVMLNNQAEFGITVSEAVWLFVWRSFLLLFALIIALIALRCLSKKAFVYTLAVLSGLILASYIQVLFLNDEALMGVNGSMLRASVWQYIWNMLLYLIIAAIPVVLVFLERKYKKSFTSKLVLLFCAVVFGMQAVGVVTAASSAPSPAENNELYYFSVDEQLKLSTNDNIIVFVLDRFDTGVADDIFKKDETTKDIFSGFTFYRNNISEYPGTFPSVASLLTGKTFDKNTGKQIEYLKDAWQDEVLSGTLHENGYKVNALIDSVATFYDFKDLDSKFDNIKQVNKKDRKVKGADFFTAMMSFALTRQSPAAMKMIFWNQRYLDIANYCVKIKNTPDYFPRTVSGSSDLRFYDKLKTHGLSASGEQNAFSFVHLQASHNPYLYDENFKKPKGLLDTYDKALSQTRGTFKILNKYFSQMKDLGIYENSTIILLGDHGTWNNKTELKTPSLTSLFIKEKGADGALKIDEDSELSNGNLHSTLLELAGAEEKKPAASYFDIIKNGGSQTRHFYWVRWVNLNSCFYDGTYKVTGNASKIENWHKID